MASMPGVLREVLIQPPGSGFGMQEAALEYQIVLPGSYVALKDPAYARGWTSVAMQKSGDGFSAAPLRQRRRAWSRDRQRRY